MASARFSGLSATSFGEPLGETLGKVLDLPEDLGKELELIGTLHHQVAGG